MTCWLCSPGPCLTPDDCGPRSIRGVMARIPALERFCARLNDPGFPTAEEAAEARHALAQDRFQAQGELKLEPERVFK